MTDQGIGAGSSQLVALLDGYCVAPVAAKVPARPDGKQKAADRNSSSNPEGPQALRPELAIEPGQRDARYREQDDHDQESEGPHDWPCVRLEALGGFGICGLDPPIENKGDPEANATAIGKYPDEIGRVPLKGAY